MAPEENEGIGSGRSLGKRSLDSIGIPNRLQIMEMMENTENKDIEMLLADCLSGEADAAEMKAVEAWLAESAEHRELYRRISAYWNADVTSDADISRGYELLSRKLAGTRFRFGRAAAYAAGMAASLLVGLAAGFGMTSGRGSDVTAYVTGESTSSVVLPDGTRVKLNRNTTLKVPDAYGRRSRNVELDGEAYFDVVHDEGRKFNVKMGDVDVTVLGTEFNAVNRQDDGVVSASLVKGSVLFSTPSQKIRLSPGRMARYDVRRDEVALEEFDKDTATAWTVNLIRYKSVHVRDLIEKLARERGVAVMFRDGAFGDDDIVSGSLESTIPFDQMLSVLQAQVGFVWERNGKDYVIASDWER